MPTPGLKVWGGVEIVDGKQTRLVIAARSKKRIVELADAHCGGRFTMHTLNTYWSPTGNAGELALIPGGDEEYVWAREEDRQPPDWRRLHPPEGADGT